MQRNFGSASVEPILRVDVRGHNVGVTAPSSSRLVENGPTWMAFLQESVCVAEQASRLGVVGPACALMEHDGVHAPPFRS